MTNTTADGGFGNYARLSIEMIERSPEIASWLKQFPNGKQPTAVNLLSRLLFVGRDLFSNWLKSRLKTLPDPQCALYAVRKFDDTVDEYWDADGNPPGRPAESLGSEDTIQGILANVLKDHECTHLDHPSIEDLKLQRIRHIVFIDDSIGSGTRVAKFIDLFFNNKKIFSWWSYGLFQVHIIAFSRTRSGESEIRDRFPGSDHHQRKFPKSQKVHFKGRHLFEDSHLSARWGSEWRRIVNLCDSETSIPSLLQRGFGGVMANIVFYHSVPDNIPGVLYYDGTETWTPLFPNRTFPDWLPTLLENGDKAPDRVANGKIDENLFSLLQLVRRGVRAFPSIGAFLGLDPLVVAQLARRAQSAGLLTEKGRLTLAGYELLKMNLGKQNRREIDRLLYVPQKWCVGRETVQPPDLSNRNQAESEAVSAAEDGDAGQVSLERTDARLAKPTPSVVPQVLRASRSRDDTSGPAGEKSK